MQLSIMSSGELYVIHSTGWVWSRSTGRVDRQPVGCRLHFGTRCGAVWFLSTCKTSEEAVTETVHAEQ